MNQFLELFRKENMRGFMSLEITQSYRDKWFITVRHSTNDNIIFSVEEGNMNLAFAKAYVNLYEHLFKTDAS